MNRPFQPDSKQQRIIEIVPLLVELGRTADRSVIDDSRMPNSWDFGALWQQWDHVVIEWEAAQVADLIKGLIYFESMFDRQFGSVPPASNLFQIYASMVHAKERDRFADWILANTINDYMPFGTNNHGARNLDELKKKDESRKARKQATASHEHAKFEEARNRRSLKATEKLPNALRRMDAKAVAALIAKGAQADAIGTSDQSARDIARELGIEAWLCNDAVKDK